MKIRIKITFSEIDFFMMLNQHFLCVRGWNEWVVRLMPCLDMPLQRNCFFNSCFFDRISIIPVAFSFKKKTFFLPSKMMWTLFIQGALRHLKRTSRHNIYSHYTWDIIWTSLSTSCPSLNSNWQSLSLSTNGTFVHISILCS